MTDLATTTPEQALVARVQELTARLEDLSDPEARSVGDDLAGAIVEMYGDGLARIFVALQGEDPALVRVRDTLASDGVVASLMLMHELYPVDLETRVLEALDEVRPYLESHEGNVELLGIDEGAIAHLKLLGSCDGCGASAATLESAIEESLRAHAPDLRGIHVEGVAPVRNVTPNSEEAREKTWAALEGASEIQRGHMVRASQGLLVANIAGTLLAYKDFCAGCPASLSSGVLLGGTLTCASCGRAYDLPRAGRCKTDSTLQLEPVPLLRGADGVKVAVEAPDEDDAKSTGCELCPSGVAVDHRHLLHLDDRRILCVCETCWSRHSGDAEYRPTGSRTLWLEDFEMPEDVWAQFDMPTGLAFLMRSGASGTMIALYPSPAGATECELPLDAWDRLVARNPILERLEPDAEALVVNRLEKAGGGNGGQHLIVPIDQCYKLVGAIKESWEGISGGDAVDNSVREFFGAMRQRAEIG